MPKPSKIENLMELLKEKAKLGDFILMPHAVKRGNERSISIPDITYILINGFHESRKDTFHEEFQEWNYSVRGKTIDQKDLRIIISFDERKTIIVTVIHLTRNKA